MIGFQIIYTPTFIGLKEWILIFIKIEIIETILIRIYFKEGK